jgi:hypothetical protein
MKKNKEVATTKKAQNSSTAPVSQLPSLSEAFSPEFATIGFEEIKNDPIASKMMAILYSQGDKELKIARKTITDLTAQVKYYKAISISNIAYAIINVLGTLIVGIGISQMNWWLVVIGSILVLVGNIAPLLISKHGDKI